jgi:hypothetical protein
MIFTFEIRTQKFLKYPSLLSRKQPEAYKFNWFIYAYPQCGARERNGQVQPTRLKATWKPTRGMGFSAQFNFSPYETRLNESRDKVILYHLEPLDFDQKQIMVKSNRTGGLSATLLSESQESGPLSSTRFIIRRFNVMRTTVDKNSRVSDGVYGKAL